MNTGTYEQLRDSIIDGDVFFIRKNTTLIARIIRFFTRSSYSHVGIAFWVNVGGKQRLLAVEAQGGSKRRIVSMSFYKDNNIDIIRHSHGISNWGNIVDVALERLGQARYGWLEAVYVGLREFLLKTFKIKLPFTNMPGEICSEFVAKVYNMPNEHVSPQGLMEQMLERNFQHVIMIKKPA